MYERKPRDARLRRRASTTAGFSLGTTLLVAMVVLLLGTTLASLAVFNLHVAGGYYGQMQAEMLARAAVAQFAWEQEQRAASPLQEQQGASLLSRYADRPVFPDGGAELPGKVEITFDTSKPYYSLDNSQGEQVAAGWNDRGSPARTVPPYCVDLLMTITVGSRAFHYEAAIQRRWPYALTSTAMIAFMGRPVENGTSVEIESPSTVDGGVLVLKEPLKMPADIENPTSGASPGAQASGLPPLSTPSPEPIPITGEMAQNITRWVPKDTNAKVIVGSAVTYGALGGGKSSSSGGNRLSGRVDFVDGPSKFSFYQDVLVGDGSEWRGAKRYNVTTPEQLDRLAEVFRLPAIPPGSVDLGHKLGPPKGTTGHPFFLLTREVRLGRGQADQDTATTLSAAGSYFVLQGSAGNRMLEIERPRPGTVGGLRVQEAESSAGIYLENCVLRVVGNLDLSAPHVESTETTSMPTLTGQNATLIVEGNLVLTDASLSALDQGMVIYCERLLMKASGTFTGLILAREGAMFFPGKDGRPLEITGAVITGGKGVEYVPVDLVTHTLGHPLQGYGFNLWGTRLKYDPRYLKRIHALGTYSLLALRRLP